MPHVAREDHLSLNLADPELKGLVTANAIQICEEPVTRLIGYFSSWVKLQKSVAWLLRFKDWLRSRAEKRKEKHLTIPQVGDDKEQASVEKGAKDLKGSEANKHLTVNDMSQAELEIMKSVSEKDFLKSYSG